MKGRARSLSSLQGRVLPMSSGPGGPGSLACVTAQPCHRARRFGGSGVRGAHRKGKQFLLREAWDLSWGDPEATATQAGSLLKAAGVSWAGTGCP